jgi:hypothetical protein
MSNNEMVLVHSDIRQRNPCMQRSLPATCREASCLFLASPRKQRQVQRPPSQTRHPCLAGCATDSDVTETRPCSRSGIVSHGATEPLRIAASQLSCVSVLLSDAWATHPAACVRHYLAICALTTPPGSWWPSCAQWRQVRSCVHFEVEGGLSIPGFGFRRRSDEQ